MNGVAFRFSAEAVERPSSTYSRSYEWPSRREQRVHPLKPVLRAVAHGRPVVRRTVRRRSRPDSEVALRFQSLRQRLESPVTETSGLNETPLARGPPVSGSFSFGDALPKTSTNANARSSGGRRRERPGVRAVSTNVTLRVGFAESTRRRAVASLLRQDSKTWGSRTLVRVSRIEAHLATACVPVGDLGPSKVARRVRRRPGRRSRSPGGPAHGSRSMPSTASAIGS